MARVAVLGAGFQGVCVALELAARGIAVDLHDRHEACITQAGARNEGKIHLGFVYANDPSFETARLLARGALAFDAALRRWLDGDVERVGVSGPHHYAVHRDSLLSEPEVLAHFARVRDLVAELASGSPRTYLGQDARGITFEQRGLDDTYDPASIAAVIRTDERSVNVRTLADRLRARVAAEPRIAFSPRTEITGAVRRPEGSIEVSFTRDAVPERKVYRHVINCLWDGRAAIDRTMRLAPAYRALYRLKFAVTATLARPNGRVPSTTFVVGPFGDVVQLDERCLYLSWYPVARRAMSHALAPPSWPRQLPEHDAGELFDATLAAFSRLLPPLRSWHRGLFSDVSVDGGVIVAAGETDIHDRQSGLHARSAAGIRSIDGYHSVDTGKYTLAPMFAVEVVDRICGR